MFLKISEQDGSRIVAACDSELLGQVFEEGGATLDLKTHEPFFRGEEVDADALREALRDFSSANLVGEECVGVAIKSGLARKEDVRYIKEIPHLQIYKV